MNTSRTQRIMALIASVCMSIVVMVTVLALFDITPSADAVVDAAPAATRAG